MKIYGPYERNDGRSHIIHFDEENNSRRTQSYPRFLMEQVMGRELTSSEHVDHINGDRTDNRLANLQIFSPQDNGRKSIIERGLSAKTLDFLCPVCGKEFTITRSKHKRNQITLGYRGPYCSHRCSGIASHVK